MDPIQEETQVKSAWEATSKEFNSWTREYVLCSACQHHLTQVIEKFEASNPETVDDLKKELEYYESYSSNLKCNVNVK